MHPRLAPLYSPHLPSHLTVRKFLSCAKRVLRRPSYGAKTRRASKHPSFVERLQWLQTLREQALCCCCSACAHWFAAYAQAFACPWSWHEHVCGCLSRVYTVIHILRCYCEHGHPCSVCTDVKSKPVCILRCTDLSSILIAGVLSWQLPMWHI